MILEFIWIEDYGVIKNQGFNFNPNIFYSFNKETGELSKVITEEIPIDFFNIKNDTITNISALVGANGTGKSTILEFIASFLTHFRPLGGFVITDKYIINKSDNKIKLSDNWIGEKKTIIERLELINIYRKNEGYSEFDKTENDKNHPLGLQIFGNLVKDTRIINFSGEINLQNTTRVYQSLLNRSDEYENSYYSDISDIALMSHDQNKYRSDKAVYSGENPILAHRSGESQRFLNLIFSDYNKFIPFSIDNLSINMIFNDIDTTFFDTYDEMAFSAIINLLIKLIEKNGFEISKKDRQFFSEIESQGLGGFFKRKFHEYKPKKSNEDLKIHLCHHLLLRHVREQIMQTMGELSEKDKLTQFLTLIQDIQKSFTNTKSYPIQILDYFQKSKFGENYIGKLNIETLNIFIDTIVKLKIWENEAQKFNLTKLSESNKISKALNSFDEKSGLKYNPSTIFDLDIRGLSTGEKQFLKIFSRFVAYNLNNKSNYQKVKQFIILIDEFEIGFHPLWQRKFLKIWIDFLEKYINQSEEKKIKVQLILTSHSPFVVSDLPKQCINFLTKSETNNSTTLDSLNNHNSTFGANIHSLFTDAFFINDGLMGDFAQYKIDSLIKEIYKTEKYTYADYNKLKPQINIIGEPFIRAKLLEKIASGMTQNDIDILISDKEKETEYLKSIRDDKNPK